MEALPLELQEQIFAYLLSHKDLKWMVKLPGSTLSERTDVYNLRLTSRRIHTGVSQSFVRIIQDVPTECREKSLKHLAALIELPAISSNLTCLTLNTCKLFNIKGTIEDDAEMNHRASWLKERLEAELVAIIHKAPRLQHLVCVVEAIRGCSTKGRSARIDKNVAQGPDPMQILHRALTTTTLHTTLTTLIILTPFPTAHAWPVFPQQAKYLPFPAVKHFTFTPSAYFLTTSRARTPHLTSLHIILDDRTPHATSFPAVPPGLQEYTINGQNVHVRTEDLIDALTPVLQCGFVVPCVTVRDVVVVVDIGYSSKGFGGEGRMGRLGFEGVRYCFEDEIMLIGPSEPRGLDAGWKSLEELRARAEECWIR